MVTMPKSTVIRHNFGDANPVDHVILYDNATPPNQFKVRFPETFLNNGDYIDTIITPGINGSPMMVQVLLHRANGTIKELA